MRLWPAQVINGDTGEICMNVASTSPFLKLSVGRAAYRCKECAEKAEGAQGAPGSASAALRCLWASPTVHGSDGLPTPLRVATVARLLVHAPPDARGWRAPTPGDLPAHAPAASPQRAYLQEEGDEARYTYTAEESYRMWLASHPFRGSPPLPA